MWSAMAFTARRTVANVMSSAIRPRQPEVPNLMGEAFIAAYCTCVGIVHKDERKKQKDCGGFRLNKEHGEDHASNGWAISDCFGYVRVDGRSATDRKDCRREEAGGLREYFAGRRRIRLSMERKRRAGARGFGDDEDHRSKVEGIGEGSEAHAQLR